MRTIAEIDADIAAIEQRKIRPLTDLMLDPRGDQGIGAPAVSVLRDLNAQHDALVIERTASVAAGPQPRNLSKMEFMFLVIGAVGEASFLSFRTNPALALQNAAYDAAVIIQPSDMANYWPAVVAAGLVTQDQVDAITAAWPVA